jgi:hypothetical protein
MKKWTIYILYGLILGSCTFEEDIIDDNPIPDDPLTKSSSDVRLKITFPDSDSPFTRAISAADENGIDTLDVLVFTSGGTANRLEDVYAYRLEAVKGPNADDVKDSIIGIDGRVKIVTLPFRSLAESLRIVLLANLPKGLRDNVIKALSDSDEGVTTANTIFEQLKFTGNPWREEPTSIAYTPFPMFGERTDFIDVHHGAPHPAFYRIEMTRAVAKINVGVDINNSTGGSGYNTIFKIDSVYVCNFSDKGDVYPYLTKPDGRVSATGYPFPAGNTKLVNAIYVPESDGWAGPSDPKKPAFLVVAAKYSKAGTVASETTNRYYRIDFIRDADYLSLDRNKVYTINILSIKTEGYPSLQAAMDAMPSTLNFDMSIEGANSDINDISVYENNQYLLGLSVNEVIFSWDKKAIGGVETYVVRVYSTYNNGEWSVVSVPTAFTASKVDANTLNIQVKAENHTGEETVPDSIILRAGALTKAICVRQMGGANSVVMPLGTGSTTIRLPLAFAKAARTKAGLTWYSMSFLKDSILWIEKKDNGTPLGVTLTTNLVTSSSGQEYIEVTAAPGVDDHFNAGVALMWENPDGVAMVGGDNPYEVVWSWHIWGIKSDENVNSNYHNPNQLLLMSKLLGAENGVNNFRLYYQWGRKDPFFYWKIGGSYPRIPDNFDYEDPDIRYVTDVNKSILYPTIFFRGDVVNSSGYYDWLKPQNDNLWNNSMEPQTKSYYDPCPEGWRVPPRYGISDNNPFSPWQNVGKINGDLTFGLGEVDLNDQDGGGGGGNKYTLLWTSTVSSIDGGSHAVYISDGNPATLLDNKPRYRASGLSVRCVKDLSKRKY